MGEEEEEGECEICGYEFGGETIAEEIGWFLSGRGAYRCDRCGALVCGEHYDADRGVCTECAEEIEEE